MVSYCIFILQRITRINFYFVREIIFKIDSFEDCTCAGEKPANYVDEDWNVTKAFVPRATNGQIFPWNNIRLPPFIKPTRYNITIHPNLTTLEVKGIDCDAVV